MAQRWRDGYSVVYAVRDHRSGEGFVKRVTAKWFYRLLDRVTDTPIPLDAGECRLVDRQALNAIRSVREHNRYLRGTFASVGFDQTGVRYVRPARFAGTTKFSMRKMTSFATDGILSFSTAPLRLAPTLGFFISTLAFLAGFAAIVATVAGVFVVPGWASLSVAVALLRGMRLIILGVIGEYIVRTDEEVRRRALYLVRDTLGLDAEGLSRAPEGPQGLRR